MKHPLSVTVCDAIEYNVCHVCDTFTTMSVTSMRSLSTMPVTSVEGGGGWWVQISALILQHFLSVRVSQKVVENNKTLHDYNGSVSKEMQFFIISFVV
jgi:hypothetical protein